MVHGKPLKYHELLCTKMTKYIHLCLLLIKPYKVSDYGHMTAGASCSRTAVKEKCANCVIYCLYYVEKWFKLTTDRCFTKYSTDAHLFRQ